MTANKQTVPVVCSRTFAMLNSSKIVKRVLSNLVGGLEVVPVSFIIRLNTGWAKKKGAILKRDHLETIHPF